MKQKFNKINILINHFLLRFNFDIYETHNFWNLLFGTSIQWLGIFSVNQVQVQRYLSLPTKQQAKMFDNFS